ncbi:hypothetical protein PGB90_003651 [Kerria lacca]
MTENENKIKICSCLLFKKKFRVINSYLPVRRYCPLARYAERFVSEIETSSCLVILSA